MDLLASKPMMSNYFGGDPNQAWGPSYWTFNEPKPPTSHTTTQEMYPTVSAPHLNSFIPQQQLPPAPSYMYNTQEYNHLPGTSLQPPRWYQSSWMQPATQSVPQTQQVPNNVIYNNYTAAAYPTPRPSVTAPIPSYLSPGSQPQPTLSRHNSARSNVVPSVDRTVSEVSRSVSPNPNAIADYGYKNPDGSWSCAWPGCTSRSRFTRACDLRKHYKRHSKTLFCRQEGCPQATEGGFSSKKDRARHEAKHNPMITCEWDNCGRLFSRVDNMVSYFSIIVTQCEHNMKTSADFAG